AAGKLLDAGQLAIVQGVSYPNPNRSHFRSMAIWQSARLDPEEHGGLGWLGRALDENSQGGQALLVGSGAPPVAIRGRRSVASAIEGPEDFTVATNLDPRKGFRSDPFTGRRDSSPSASANDLAAFVQRSMLDAYTTADTLNNLARVPGGGIRYPENELGNRLQLISRLMKSGFGARVYYTIQPGYDTHSSQLQIHSRLLLDLATALKAFLDDLTATKVAERVAVL